MKKTCFLSIDVERDNWGDQNTFKGVEDLDNVLNIFKKHQAKATLFITGKVLEKYPEMARKWAKDYEIGCHGYEHLELEKIDLPEREKQIKKFIELYRAIFKRTPKGFRAPRNIIDNEQFLILEKYNFVYDSSVLPRYPWPIRRYDGYRGRALIVPYWPSKKDYRKASLKEEVKIFEIPEAPITFFGLPVLNVPLVATWLRKWGVGIFKLIFFFRKPKFISFSMHPWDGVEFGGRNGKNSGERFLKQLDQMLGFLKKTRYEFKTGEEILEIYKNSF
jgi:peptidoglycan/xylan/chitin deacetylase (PgdA/CDA1 family)